MLGRDLHVRRFTPRAGKVLGLAASDIGRSLHDLELAIAGSELEGLALESLDTLAVIERDVRDEEGRWYSLCVRPYRTQEDNVDGPALTECPPAVSMEPSWSDEATVLVVDDESDVRELLQDALPHFGFRVEVASGGAQGAEMLGASGDRIDVVLLDMTMPGMNGAATFPKSRQLRPDLPIVLMSGYDESELVRAFPPSSLAGFLAKPFGFEQVAALLRHVLGSSGTGDEQSAPSPTM